MLTVRFMGSLKRDLIVKVCYKDRLLFKAYNMQISYRFFCAASACHHKFVNVPNLNERNCSTYIDCHGGHFIEVKTCPDETFFNPATRKCDKNYQCLETSHADFHEICSELGPGNHSILADKSCSSYVHCDSKDLYSIYFCPTNLVFDMTTQRCLKSKSGSCSNNLLLQFCTNRSGAHPYPTEFNCRA